jgi:hypothetical protein
MVIGHWKELHTDDLYNLYSTNVSRVIESRKMFWVRHMTLVGKRELCV